MGGKKKKHSKKTAEFVYAGWWGQHWAAWQKYVYIHCRTSLAQLFFSCVRGQSSQGMFPFSAVRFTARKLILWAEGYPSAFSNPTSQTETRCICAHIFSLFWSKNSKGWSEQSLLRGKSVQTSLKESRAFPSSSSSFSPACVLLTKTADRRLRINSMEPADESKEEKESRGRQRSCIKTPPGKNNTWLLADWHLKKVCVSWNLLGRFQTHMGGKMKFLANLPPEWVSLLLAALSMKRVFHHESLRVIKCIWTGTGPHINYSNRMKRNLKMNLLIISKTSQKEAKRWREQVAKTHKKRPLVKMALWYGVMFL